MFISMKSRRIKLYYSVYKFEFILATLLNCNNRGWIRLATELPQGCALYSRGGRTSHQTHNRTIQSNQSMIIITDVKRSHPISSIADPVWVTC